ncbi:MAG: hypothetical protein OH319_03830 [Candidatus Parvarchaeota archaeon]|nr:hypothetical protein [Candidatus Jingweiarchaeum tengchongense]MCW1298610.1 hypothetical protein [Candidatus Jingweiarchaeum tengchongense]MCW1300456.1 hypothetical protein [Candidatus Jingweiarchaeum tengchongense]MCW1304954.1 hypothetical protein [Candidatus Jingweiarchaeum tengchongense]MCW1305486.1 hypothetical protein [Candidatus Jingweiarchaeum tengchongense]
MLSSLSGLEIFNYISLYMPIPILLLIFVIIFIKFKENKKRKIEEQFLNFLYTISGKLKQKVALEQAVYESIGLRKDELGTEFKKSFKPNYSFEQVLDDFSKRMNSKKISSITNLIITLKNSKVELSQALESISSELWSMWLLEKERDEKLNLIANMVLINGMVFTPLAIGIIQGIFLSTVYPSVQFFIMSSMIISVLIYCVIKNKLYEAALLIPIGIFLASFSFLLPIKIYLHIPLI